MYKFKLILIVLLTAYACQDAYEIDPKDEVFEENAFNTVDQLETGLYGVYNAIYNGAAGTNLIDFSSKFVDDLKIAGGNRGQGIQIFTWSINSGTDEVAGIWNNYYAVINRANRILRAAEGIEAVTVDEQIKKDLILAELYAIRGFAHFDLMRLYSESYELNSLAIPIVDEVFVYEQPARNTVGDVAQFIKNDFDKSQNIFTALGPIDQDLNRVSSIAVTALQARLSLYLGEYQNAIDYSSDVIQNATIATTRDEYVGIWTDDYTEENLWQLARTTGQQAIGTLFTDTNGDIFFNVSTELFEVLQNNGFTDDHRTFAVIDTQNFDPANIPVGKYLGSQASPALNNIKLLRTSEQYLIRAEAYARTNQLSLASADMETLKNARKDVPATVGYTSVENALTDILSERRIELAYEGHRMFDLKRYELGVDRFPEDCDNAAGACSLDATSHLFSLPVPQSEIFANDNITQNPGY